MQELRSVSASAICLEVDTIWFSGALFNSFWKYDRKEKKLNFISFFVNQDKGDRLHRKIIPYKEKLFFIPAEARGVDVFNREKMCWEKTIYPKDNHVLSNRIPLIISQNIVWLIPQCLKETLYILDMESCSINKEKRWEEKINQVFDGIESNYSVPTKGICFVQNKIWMALYNENHIISIDVHNLEMYVINFDAKYHFHSIIHDGNSYWITQLYSNTIIKVRKFGAEVYEIINKIEGKNADVPYVSAISLKDKIILVPYELESFFVIDKISNDIKRLNICSNDFGRITSEFPLFFDWEQDEKEIYFSPGAANQLIVLNTESWEIEGINLIIPECLSNEVTLKDICQAQIERRGLIVETKDIKSLQTYIQMLKNYDYMIYNNKSKIGLKLHEYIMDWMRNE